MVFNGLYIDFPDANTSIETLDVPEECITAMKRFGIEYIGDMLDVYRRMPIGVDVLARMGSDCISQVYREIITFSDCPWRGEIENWLVKWVEKD